MVWHVATLTWVAMEQPLLSVDDVTISGPLDVNVLTIPSIVLSQYTPVSGRLPVDGSGVIQPISVESLPLPSTAATGAKQDTGNTSLSSVDTKLTSQATGAKQDTGNTSLSSIDTKLTSQATASKQDTGNVSLASIDSKLANPLSVTGSFSVADVMNENDSAGYVDGDTAKKLTQTPEGRLRVSSVSAVDYIEVFRERDDLFFGVPVMATDGPYLDVANNPWGF